MAEVPEGFPSELSDSELEENIKAWSSEYRERWPQSTLPELVLAFINTASQEQLRRQVAAAAASADKTARWALAVSFAALIVAVLSLVVSLLSQ